jgi:hypothetical protein
MDEVKLAHYVPRCYLKSFSNEKRICVYFKDKILFLENQNIEKIAAEKYFYDFTDTEINDFKKYIPDFHKQYIEKLYSNNVEIVLSEIIQKLLMAIPKNIMNKNIYLNNNLKEEIAYLIVFQLFRTKKYRNFLQSIYQLDANMAAKLQKESILNMDNIIAFKNTLVKSK